MLTLAVSQIQYNVRFSLPGFFELREENTVPRQVVAPADPRSGNEAFPATLTS